MPDLEQRMKDILDRLGERPDAARVLERVGRRKRHLRLVHRVQSVALVVAVLAGVAGGTYALTRAFGVGSARPAVRPTPSPAPSSPTSAIALCSGETVVVSVASQEGAAGTVSTLWRVRNTSSNPCRSLGYPAVDLHTSSGWLNVQLHRGGFPNINQQPTSMVLPPGKSLYFVTYWSDATTNAGSCRQFDRVRVTLPGSNVPAEVATSGCVNSLPVDVGPVTSTPPS